MDLSPATLEFLVNLMCAQARECLLEKGELNFLQKKSIDVDDSLVVGQEAGHVCIYITIWQIFLYVRTKSTKKCLINFIQDIMWEVYIFGVG